MKSKPRPSKATTLRGIRKQRKRFRKIIQRRPVFQENADGSVSPSDTKPTRAEAIGAMDRFLARRKPPDDPPEEVAEEVGA